MKYTLKAAVISILMIFPGVSNATDYVDWISTWNPNEFAELTDCEIFLPVIRMKGIIIVPWATGWRSVLPVTMASRQLSSARRSRRIAWMFSPAAISVLKMG
jgi:hypothetical protein